MTRDARGMTVFELIVVVLAVVCIVVVMVPMGSVRTTGPGWQARCMTNLRGIHMGLVAWSNDNDGRFPLPSLVDAADQTEISDDPGMKNRTGNVWSLLLFHSLIAEPAVFVSPMERNPGVEPIDFSVGAPIHPSRSGGAPNENPHLARNTVNPEHAVYDPSFKGTPYDRPLMGPSTMDLYSGTEGVISNNSYAHSPLVGAYLDKWAINDNPSPTNAVIGSRGPRYAGDDRARNARDWALLQGEHGTDSFTLLFLGPKDAWQGNLFFNDGHAIYAKKPSPDGLTLRDGEGRDFSDNVFVSEGGPIETDPMLRTDNYLRPFSRGYRTDTPVTHQQLAEPATPGRDGFIWID